MWANLGWFYERAVPVAGRPGCASACTRTTPRCPTRAGGAARITASIENYHRVFDLAPGEANAMLFCQGCVAEMGGTSTTAIRSVGARGKIGLVHFRDIRGTPEDFVEVFIDEGQNDMLETMRPTRRSASRGRS